MCRQATQLASAQTQAPLDRRKVAAVMARLLDRMVCSRDNCEPTLFDSAEVPTISVHDYTMRFLRQSNFSLECIAIAYVYISRFVAASTLRSLNLCTVHRLLLTAVVLAVKIQDDVHYTNRVYARIGGISCKELNMLEAELLQRLGWRMQVSPIEFEDAATIIFGGSSEERWSHCAPKPSPCATTTMGSRHGGA